MKLLKITLKLSHASISKETIKNDILVVSGTPAKTLNCIQSL